MRLTSILLSSLSMASSKRVIPKIVNFDLPSCIDCIHFIGDKTNYPYDPRPNDSDNGRCRLYGEKNIISGEIKYLFASKCRQDSKLCGMNANFKVSKPIAS